MDGSEHSFSLGGSIALEVVASVLTQMVLPVMTGPCLKTLAPLRIHVDTEPRNPRLRREWIVQYYSMILSYDSMP